MNERGLAGLVDCIKIDSMRHQQGDSIGAIGAREDHERGLAVAAGGGVGIGTRLEQETRHNREHDERVPVCIPGGRAIAFQHFLARLGVVAFLDRLDQLISGRKLGVPGERRQTRQRCEQRCENTNHPPGTGADRALPS